MVDKARATRSMAWSALENGGLAVISFLSLILYSRMMSTEEFGVFSVVLAVIELLGLLVGMLFHDALIQKADVGEAHFDTAFTFSLLLSFVLLALCVLAAPAYARSVGDPRIASVLCWMALGFPFSAACSSIMARQRRELEFRSLAMRSLIGRVTGAVIGIAAVALGAGVWGLVAQQVLMQAVGCIVLWMSCRNKPSLRINLAHLKSMLHFGAASVSGLFLGFSIKRVFTIFVGVYLGSGPAGVLNLAFRAVDVLWAIASTAVSQVALPVLAGLQADKPRFNKAYLTANRLTCFVLYGCFGGLGAVAPELVELLFGSRWLVSAPYVSALAFLIFVQAPRLFGAPVLTALGHPRYTLVALAAELGLMLGAIAAFGMPTLQWAIGIWIARELAGAPLMSWLLRRIAGIPLADQLRGVVTSLVASITMILAIWYLRHALPTLSADLRMLIFVPTGALIYLVTVALLERQLIRSAVDIVLSAIGRSAVTPLQQLPGK